MGTLFWDIETDGLPAQEGELLCAGWAVDDEPVTCDWHWREELRQLLLDPTVPKVSFTKYDPRYAMQQGFQVNGPIYDVQVMAWVLNENQFLSLDMVARRYLGLQMDKRIKRRGGKPMFQQDDGELVSLVDAPREQMTRYNVDDVEVLRKLFYKLRARLEETDWWDYFLAEEVPFTRALLEMEVAGLPVDLRDTADLAARVEVEAADLAQSLLREGSLPDSFNLNSGDQLAAYLYHPVFEMRDAIAIDERERTYLKAKLAGYEAPEELPDIDDPIPPGFDVGKVGRGYAHGVWTLRGRGLPPTERTDSGSRWSTSTPVLKSNLVAAADPWVQQLLEYRKREKALTTYLRRFPEIAISMEERQGKSTRIFGRFNQTGTKTGRLSSSEPNLQNIPSHGELGEAIRGLFRGDLVVGDYSQLEPRLMAHFSFDPVLLDVYTKGKDIYLVTAEGIFGGTYDKDSTERGIAKTLVLAMGYGAGPGKVAQILTVNGFPTTEDTAKDYLRELQSLYGVFFAWREEVIRRVKVKGYVTTIGGRHRRLKAAFKDRRNWKLVGYGERQAVNAVVQGSAGDIVRRVMVAQDCGEWKQLRLLAQVHDELVWESPVLHQLRPKEQQGTLAGLRDLAENQHGFKLNVPLLFEPLLCKSWADKGTGMVVPEDLNEETTGYEESA